MKNIFHSFTRKCLAANRVRTLVTIIGIVLSMTLFTAVLEGAYSGQQYLINCVKAETGAWEGNLTNVGAAGLERLSAEDRIKDYTLTGRVGWADLDIQNDYKPYLLVESLEEGFENFLAVRTVRGRLPENSSEIVIPKHLGEQTGVVYDVGDTITLSVGERMFYGSALSETDSYSPSETLDVTGEKTYTVTGIIERMDYEVENFSCPGYMAFTFGEKTETHTCYFTLKNPRSIYSFLHEQNVSGSGNVHRDLMNMYGVTGFNGLNLVIGGFAVILVALICFGSVSLIYNSFSISLGERKKLFGILKSVGATRKQIRSSVMYEALCLCGIGIPVGLAAGCGAIGLVLFLLRDTFRRVFGYVIGPEGQGAEIKLVVNPLILLIAVAVCLVTTLISAFIPAKAVEKVSPIESIRQSDDLKIRPGSVKTSKLTQKIWGFPGMMASKNFKRNRKRYRSVVVSLFLSVLLFISASSLTSYLRESVNTLNSEDNQTDIHYYSIGEEMSDEDIMKLLSDVKGVQEGLYYRETSVGMRYAPDALTDRYLEFTGYPQSQEAYPDGTIYSTAYLVFLEDGEFNELCRQNGLDPQKYYDTGSPAGIACNTMRTMGMMNGGRHWLTTDILKADSLPVTGKVEVYDQETWEVTGDAQFVIADVVEEPAPFRSSGVQDVYYPLSMLEAVLEKSGYESWELSSITYFAFRAADHASAFTEMKKVLQEQGMDDTRLQDYAEKFESMRMVVTVIDVFAYCFIILISLIAAANVFNTVSTNVSQRRREFAMLKSVGMDSRAFRKMLSFECIIYGLKGLIYGLPVSILVTYLIYRVVGIDLDLPFYIPVHAIIIAVASVFVVVFITMLYAGGRMKKDNLIDALKNETF
ncbi:MAG: ABC transporter permease [Eubacterium sp.]|nr:ABC transporter permease [Eubacterium sp.]